MKKLNNWIGDWNGHLALWLGAILVGLTMVIFAEMVIWAENSHQTLKETYGMGSYLLTPLGFMFIAWLGRSFFPNVQGSGIPQTIAALKSENKQMRRALLSFRVAFGKIFLSTLGFLVGGSIGRAGPSVHIGAALMFSVGDHFKLKHDYLDHAFILAGSAAGIAAAFNMPLAGVVFAIEEMSRKFNEKASAAVTLVVVIAVFTASLVWGNKVFMGQSDAVWPQSWGWLILPVIGTLGGVLGGVFTLVFVKGSQLLFQWVKNRGIWVAAVCGTGVALLAWLTQGETTGSGFQQAYAIAQQTEHYGWSFPLAKMLATLLSAFSGISGGIFVPSLSIGAGIGDAVAVYFPSIDTTTIILLSIAAYFSGVAKTPITASVIVMEIFNDHTLVLPVMATSIIAFSVSTLIYNRSIYLVLAEKHLARHLD